MDFHLDTSSELPLIVAVFVVMARRRSRPKIGAKDIMERNASLNKISREVKRDEMVCDLGDGVMARV